MFSRILLHVRLGSVGELDLDLGIFIYILIFLYFRLLYSLKYKKSIQHKKSIRPLAESNTAPETSY